jgi:uncharacterized protein YkwD
MLRSGVCLAAVGWLVVPLAAFSDAPPKKEAEVKLSPVEQAILEAVNQERAKEKQQACVPHPILMKLAREHSANMARQKKLDHTLDGKNPTQRAKEAGYVNPYVAENIAQTRGVNVAQAMELWMKSAGHRGNILSPEYTRIGIGIAVDGSEVYYTQVFGAEK